MSQSTSHQRIVRVRGPSPTRLKRQMNEAVWVTPGLRRRRLGERLIKYLLTAEYWSNLFIAQFLLWMHADNAAAMRLCEYIGFVETPESKVGTRTEIKYRLDFNPEAHTTISLAPDGTRLLDQLHRAVTYRVLGHPEGSPPAGA